MISDRLRNQLAHQLEELRQQECELLQDIDVLNEVLNRNLAETLPKPISFKRFSRRNGKITFASHIHNALSTIGGPAKAIQVADLLESKGIKTKGKTTLAINVACELARLHDRPKSGVKRVSTGVYALEAVKTVADGKGSGVGSR